MRLRRHSLVVDYTSFESLARSCASSTPLTSIEYAPGAWSAGSVTGAGFDRRWFGTGAVRDVYESRVFGDGVELRWVRDGDSGAAEVWVDASRSSFAPEGAPTEHDVDDSSDRSFMLWGRVDSSDSGWATLSDGRIGAYSVPARGEGRTAVLRSREYTGRDDDGNAVVVAELLVGFAVEGER